MINFGNPNDAAVQITQDIPPGCAIVCHDAGAANVILAWFRGNASKTHRFYVSGPAIRIFQDNAINSIPCATIEDALSGASCLISGTGWASDVEHNARKIARSQSIRSIAVLDHWVNYSERFQRSGEVILPDTFWVTDDYALHLAKQTFQNADIVLQPNIYLDDQIRRIKLMNSENPAEILFVLEPIRDDWQRGVSGEFQALDYFINALPKLQLPGRIHLRLRPHPADPPEKYISWLKNLPVDISTPTISIAPPTEPLYEAISRATLVVGCQSYAMVIALKSGKRVICALPPWAPTCNLPFTEIEHLSLL